MTERKFHLHDGKKGAALAIRITPRANENRIVDILSDGTVKIHLAIEPFNEKTNEVLLNYLSEILNISTSRFEIVAGATGRDKLVSIIDLEADALHKKMLEILQNNS